MSADKVVTSHSPIQYPPLGKFLHAAVTVISSFMSAVPEITPIIITITRTLEIPKKKKINDADFSKDRTVCSVLHSSFSHFLSVLISNAKFQNIFLTRR